MDSNIRKLIEREEGSIDPEEQKIMEDESIPPIIPIIRHNPNDSNCVCNSCFEKDYFDDVEYQHDLDMSELNEPNEEVQKPDFDFQDVYHEEIYQDYDPEDPTPKEVKEMCSIEHIRKMLPEDWSIEELEEPTIIWQHAGLDNDFNKPYTQKTSSIIDSRGRGPAMRENGWCVLSTCKSYMIHSKNRIYIFLDNSERGTYGTLGIVNSKGRNTCVEWSSKLYSAIDTIIDNDKFIQTFKDRPIKKVEFYRHPRIRITPITEA